MKRNLLLAWGILSALTIAFTAPALTIAASSFAPIPVTDTPPSSASTGFVSTAAIPSLDQFSTALNKGQPNVVAGAYAPDLFALRVVKQVLDNPAYVSPINGTVTQFGLANQYGTIGLLAHNYLSGAFFARLALGNEIDIVNGDGSVRRYTVSTIRRFQALDPSSPYSNFIDLEKGGAPLSSTDLFNQIYTGGNKVVFQTCINANGNWSWGRLFVIATPR
jgi:hypothetical protein